MIIINNWLAYIGFIGWAWVWWLNRYHTGGSIRTQIGLMLFGAVWVMVIIASALQNHTPTTATVFARGCLLLGIWMLMPLLKIKPSCNIEKDNRSDN